MLLARKSIAFLILVNAAVELKIIANIIALLRSLESTAITQMGLFQAVTKDDNTCIVYSAVENMIEDNPEIGSQEVTMMLADIFGDDNM